MRYALRPSGLIASFTDEKLIENVPLDTVQDPIVSLAVHELYVSAPVVVSRVNVLTTPLKLTFATVPTVYTLLPSGLIETAPVRTSWPGSTEQVPTALLAKQPLAPASGVSTPVVSSREKPTIAAAELPP